MDCDTCGRHVPSREIFAVSKPDGSIAMACGRCRRLVARRPRNGVQRVLSAGQAVPLLPAG